MPQQGPAREHKAHNNNYNNDDIMSDSYMTWLLWKDLTLKACPSGSPSHTTSLLFL